MENKRPILVTIICILGFIGVPLQILGSIAQMIPGIMEVMVPLWYSILAILFAIAYLIGLIFIWKMKIWALIFYTVLAVIEYALMFAMDMGSVFILTISIAVIGLLWTQSSKMS